ncbi:MAG: adenosylmethionine--8-amino-7-oxononanoate transaminase [Spongiibacteraceae bacterium]
MLTTEQLLQIDRDHLWHPYASALTPPPVLPVVSAHGVRLRLSDGRELIDGVSSWWSVIHGYNHPALNAAITEQLGKMAHVMFGGLTHEPAARLAKTLVDIAPAGLTRVFFSDSGSVAVEVAIKMAQQYWIAQGRPEKYQLLAPKTGYHGDTFITMAVSDPESGMHTLFNKLLPQNIFADTPSCRFGENFEERFIENFKTLLQQHHHELAAVILEPIVQAYGGMNFYAPAYLRRVRELCDEFDVLLICDEIATGFGRTGELFACHHADISPDIFCVGKALTGGYITLAATLCSERVAGAISNGEPGAFMHGPTFMANPLACAVGNASLGLLLSQPWQRNIRRIEQVLRKGLEPARGLPGVSDVRVLGGIGVIELERPVPASVQQHLIDAGVWLRPFGKLVYTMPPYVMEDSDLDTMTAAMVAAVSAVA